MRELGPSSLTIAAAQPPNASSRFDAPGKSSVAKCACTRRSGGRLAPRPHDEECEQARHLAVRAVRRSRLRQHSRRLSRTGGNCGRCPTRAGALCRHPQARAVDRVMSPWGHFAAVAYRRRCPSWQGKLEGVSPCTDFSGTALRRCNGQRAFRPCLPRPSARRPGRRSRCRRASPQCRKCGSTSLGPPSGPLCHPRIKRAHSSPRLALRSRAPP